MTTGNPLDNPVRASLLGAHAHLAVRRGDVLRYPADVSPFIGLPDEPDEHTWPDVAALFSPGATVATAGTHPPPSGWEVIMNLSGVQLVVDDDDGVAAAVDHEAVQLNSVDVPDMLDLVRRTEPGPFLPRTIVLGSYLGIRRDGVLVAMAGERLRIPGWTEISAVCTDESVRGEGLATRLVLAVAAGIRARNERPFLHVATDNANALRLYESLGFAIRRPMRFVALQVPMAT
jgi:ribosomal protein S18 acetylase RimI-like enzyme